MNTPVLASVPGWIIAIAVFILILVFNWLGFSYKKRLLIKDPDADKDSLGTIEGALLGLMALLLAFTFSIAANKFENRRQVIIDEANAIGTAILRCDLYPDSARKLFRQDFVNYVDARVAYYDAGSDKIKIQAALKQAELYSGNIWKRAIDLSHNLDNIARTQQMIPAVNAVIDIATTREDSRLNKVPPLILFMVLMLTLVTGFLTGYSNKTKRRNKVMTLGFALMTALTLYLVLELDRPRRGWITLDAAEQKIVDLRQLLVETN